MQTVIEKLKDNLRVMYRKALDADAALDELQRQGKGKHAQIFTTDSPFRAHHRRFGPYVEEVAEDVMNLENAEAGQHEALLPAVVVKMEKLFAVLTHFKASLKQ